MAIASEETGNPKISLDRFFTLWKSPFSGVGRYLMTAISSNWFRAQKNDAPLVLNRL